MALAPVLAAALTDHSAHAYSLWVQGLDVLRRPGAPGNTYGTAIEDVSIDDLGPGGVSGLSFTIDDPAAELTINVGDEVIFWDHGADLPLFHGWVYPTVTNRPAFGGQGRTLEVKVIGPQVLLDWTYCPGGDMGFGGLDPMTIVQWLAGMSFYGAPGIRAFGTSDPFFGEGSNQARPVGSWFGGSISTVIKAGTLRNAIQQAFDFYNHSLAFFPDAPLALPQLTVDHWLGLRTWAADATVIKGPTPEDYATLSVVDTPAGAKVAAELEHTVDGSDHRHQVYVAGGNADGSGMVSDGSGRPGPITVVSDSSSLDDESKHGLARGAMWAHQARTRGSLVLEDIVPPAGVWPGSLLELTDAATGATDTYVISAIGRTFAGGRETWRVSYGALPASYIDAKGR